MATKSKNINPFIKAVCVILSAITFFFASSSALVIINYVSFYNTVADDFFINKTVEYKLTDTYALKYDTASSVRELFDLSMQSKQGDIDYSYGLYSPDYYFVNKKTKIVYTNLSESQIKSEEYKSFVKNNKYAFQSVGGKYEVTSSLNDENFKPLNYMDNKDLKNFDIYWSYNFDKTANDSYVKSYRFWEKNNSINYMSKAISCAVLLLIALTFMIISYVICGKKDRNGKVKRAFIDYVPTDIHFILSAGLIAGGVILIFFLFDTFYYDNSYIGTTYFTKLIEWSIRLLCTAIWLLFIELTTSFIRVCKSEKKIYENFLIFMIIKGLIKLDIKIAKKLIEPLTFKPEAFTKSLILSIIGYSLLNLALFAGIVFFVFIEEFLIALIGIALLFIMNAVFAGFAFDYIKKLDIIIACAHNRTPVTLNYEKLPKSLKVLTDSLRYTNQELDRAVNKAVKDERMRTELITNVSHDLKTPLTSIISYVDLLKGCDLQDENAKKYIEVLDEKGSKLKRLIEDLIEASKITSGVITLNPINLDLNELVTQAIVEHQQDFNNNNLELVLKNDTKSVFAFADGNKTYRIIENLLSNAKKYSARYTRVYTDIYEANNTCIFEIKNISAEPLDISPEELTERFVRGDKSRTNEGNGLGLSIAQNLCSAQGGRLEISIDGDLFKAKVILPKGK